MTDLTGWISSPNPVAGISFFTEGRGWERRSYDELAAMALDTAEALAEAGVGDGDVVALLTGSDPAFAAGFFGAILAGAIPSPLPLPLYLGDRAERHLSDQLAAVGAAAIVAGPRDRASSELAARIAPGLPFLVARDDPRRRSQANEVPPDQAVLAQFTSGSTGAPRGVRITRGALEQQIDAFAERVPLNERQGIVSWLPLHHDMGLLATLLFPVTHGRNLWLMAPEAFVRKPLLWLERLGTGDAVATAAPSFAYRYACRRIPERELDALSFEQWHTAIVGAERIDVGALAECWRSLGPRGFARTTFTAGYGMVETTLGLTMGDADAELSAVSIASAGLAIGEPLPVSGSAAFSELPGEDRAWLASCGRPLPGVDIAVRDSDGATLREGHVGEIHAATTTMAEAFETSDGSGPVVGLDGYLSTGDAGCMLDGELYVIGRIGDSLRVRGKTVFAEELESRLAAVPEARAGRAVALAGGTAAGTELVVVVEAEPGAWAKQVETLLRQAGTDGCRTRLIAAPAGTIIRTSSGKPRRRAMWERMGAGTLPGEVVFDSARGSGHAA